MSGYSFDSNILIDALNGNSVAHSEIARADRPWISRVTWIEVLSKERGATLPIFERFLGGFAVDELDTHIAAHAAALRRITAGERVSATELDQAARPRAECTLHPQ